MVVSPEGGEVGDFSRSLLLFYRLGSFDGKIGCFNRDLLAKCGLHKNIRYFIGGYRIGEVWLYKTLENYL